MGNVKIFLKVEFVEARLARKNWTRKMLAQRMQMSETYLWQVMNRQRYVSPAVRDKFQEVFKSANWDDLFEILK